MTSYPRIRLSSITLKPSYISSHRLGPVTTRMEKLGIWKCAELMRLTR